MWMGVNQSIEGKMVEEGWILSFSVGMSIFSCFRTLELLVLGPVDFDTYTSGNPFPQVLKPVALNWVLYSLAFLVLRPWDLDWIRPLTFLRPWFADDILWNISGSITMWANSHNKFPFTLSLYILLVLFLWYWDWFEKDRILKMSFLNWFRGFWNWPSNMIRFKDTKDSFW